MFMLMLPFSRLFLASELNFSTLNFNNLVIIAGILAALDIAMFFVSTATFQREGILTKWR